MIQVFIVSTSDNNGNCFANNEVFEFFPLAVHCVHRRIQEDCDIKHDGMHVIKVVMPSKHVLRVETNRAIELFGGTHQIYDIDIATGQSSVHYTVKKIKRIYKIELHKVQS